MNGNGNFKMKCVEANDYVYTIGKIYEVIDGYWINDNNISTGSSFIKTIEGVNEWSGSKWELVEDETSEPVKEEKSLIEIVMEKLGVEEGEEFNIMWNGSSLSTLNPFMFKDGKLLSKYKDSYVEYLGALITGEYKIEKLKWKPKNGEKVWSVYSDENKNIWCNYSIFGESFSNCVALYKVGWLFKTKEKAEANKKRVLKEMKEVMEND